MSSKHPSTMSPAARSIRQRTWDRTCSRYSSTDEDSSSPFTRKTFWNTEGEHARHSEFYDNSANTRRSPHCRNMLCLIGVIAVVVLFYCWLGPALTSSSDDNSSSKSSSSSSSNNQDSNGIVSSSSTTIVKQSSSSGCCVCCVIWIGIIAAVAGTIVGILGCTGNLCCCSSDSSTTTGSGQYCDPAVEDCHNVNPPEGHGHHSAEMMMLQSRGQRAVEVYPDGDQTRL